MLPTESMTLAEKFEYRPGLERVQGLCDILGNPEEELRFIHIAGTNGKGSTACMIASVLGSAGIRTGQFSSPAVCGPEDQFRINGQMITRREYNDLKERVNRADEALIAATGEGATPFERECATAFLFFAENHCGAVVLECGMGGRDDATNVAKDKICCVITSVSYDHMQYLGSTLGEIASAKAGIITSDCPVIALDTRAQVTSAIRRRCEETGSMLYTVDPSEIVCEDIFPEGEKVSFGRFADVTVGMSGYFQAENAALAMQALAVMADDHLIEGHEITDENIAEGLAKARWPYRFERISTYPLIYVDGAHNEDAAEKLKRTIEDRLAGYDIALVMGMFSDKEYEKVVRTLVPLADTVFTVETPGNERALPAKKLAECAQKYCQDVRACESIKEAADLAVGFSRSAGRKSAVIACGSLSYLDEFRKSL